MPCLSYDDDRGAYEYQKRADELASMLCELCGYVERSAGVNIPRGRISIWYDKHKEQDRRAAEAARKREENLILKKKALNKLTKEEIRLLGILDRAGM